MPKMKEFSNLEIQISGCSCRKIREAISCHHSTVIGVCKAQEKTGFSGKLTRCEQQKILHFFGRNLKVRAL